MSVTLRAIEGLVEAESSPQIPATQEMVVSKICTSSVFRAGLTATSLLRAVAFSNNDEQQLLQSQSPSVGTDDTALDALPWLHQLHNVVVDLYSSGEGMTTTRRTAIDFRQCYGERAFQMCNYQTILSSRIHSFATLVQWK